MKLHCDAGDEAVGAVIMQPEGDMTLAITYGSRKLLDAERKYTTVVWGVQLFRNYVWGRKFTVVVDHHALCWLERKKDNTGRLRRWYLKLMEYDYEVRHKPGKLHVVPDCLSSNCRNECTKEEEEETNEVPTYMLQLENIQKIQEKDPECHELRSAIEYPSAATATCRRQARSYLVENGVLYRRNTAHQGQSKLLVVPAKLREEILYKYHDSPLSGGHLGFSQTISKIKNRYYWPYMLKETEKYVRT